MKPAITYYGGKQTIAKRIVDLIPEHTAYIEPFCGGAAVLFAKPKSHKEVICDTLDYLVTFYRVLRTPEQSEELYRRLELTPFAEGEYLFCKDILKGMTPCDDDIEIARAVFVCAMQSFGHTFLSGFAKERYVNHKVITYHNRKDLLPKATKRLAQVEVWKMNALESIPYFDSPDAFFYCDPPYVDTNCGHYEGYAPDDYQALLDTLSSIEGKFILSGYPNEWADAMDFHTHDIKCTMGFNNANGDGRIPKTERLWANFPLKQQLTLFTV